MAFSPLNGAEGLVQPNYKLDPGSMDKLNRMIVECADREAPSSPIVAVVAPGSSDVANFGRTSEQRVFDSIGEKYNFQGGMRPYESHSDFVFTVDKQAKTPGVAHVKRIVLPNLGIKDSDGRGDGLTGIEPIDDRLLARDPREHMPLEKLLEESGLTVASLAHVFNVASNLTTGRVDATRVYPHSLLSYKATFALAQERGIEAIFAYMNVAAKRSLGKLGVETTLLGGREFHLPKTDGGYDENYVAVVIPGTDKNRNAFTDPDTKSPMLRAVAMVDVPLVAYKDAA